MHQLLPKSLLLVLVLGLESSRLAAAAPVSRVTVGDVVVKSDASAARAGELSRELRAALYEELGALPGADVTRLRRLTISATLTRLSCEQRADRARATAAISLSLLRAEDRTLLGELIGRASAEESSNSVTAVQRAALRGAVRGAVTRLPEAAKRLH